ncbi:MAG: sigma-70 family RNA polymerase sigma factor [Caldilineaceae bacterium]
MSEEQLYLEKEIIRQAQTGNQAAYGELYERHFSAIQHYIHKRVAGSGDAEDLTQTVFLKAWQALRDYQPTASPFRAWLYRIAHNTVVDHYRSQRETLAWDDLNLALDPHYAPEMVVITQERQETVQRALAQLRPAYQEILVQRFLRNMDYTEMASELGHQVNNLRVLQHRALEALRRVLSHEAVLGIAIALTMLIVGRTLVVEAAQALPGDKLYPLRTVTEETRLLLADDAAAMLLHTDFAAQRLVELRQLAQQGRSKDMVTTTSNLVSHVQAAAAQLTRLTQAQTNIASALTAQFEQRLAKQSADLVDLAATAPQELRPTIQSALTAMTEAQTELHNEKNQPATHSSEAPVVVTPVTPVHTPPAQTAPAQDKSTPIITPTPTSHQHAQPNQPTPATELPPTGSTPERPTRRPAAATPRPPSDHHAQPTAPADAPPPQVEAVRVMPTPTSAAPVKKTQQEQRKAPVPTSVTPQSDTAAQSSATAQRQATAQQAASTPPPAPAQQPAPTDTAESNTPNHSQAPKAVAPAQDKIEPPTQQQEKHDQHNEPAPQTTHSPAPSAPPKEPRPQL